MHVLTVECCHSSELKVAAENSKFLSSLRGGLEITLWCIVSNFEQCLILFVGDHKFTGHIHLT